MNRRDLLKKVSTVGGKLLQEKGYISFPDVFMGLGYLDPKDYEAWRVRRVPYLERVIHVNLSRISFIMKTVRRNSLNGALKPRHTGYVSWGKAGRVHLRFSRSGIPAIEELWSTHFVWNETLQPKRRLAEEAEDAPTADASGPRATQESQGCPTLESPNAPQLDWPFLKEQIQ